MALVRSIAKAFIASRDAEGSPSKSMLQPSPPPLITSATILSISALRLAAVPIAALMPDDENRVKVSVTCTPWLCASLISAFAVAPPQPCVLPILPALSTSAENHATSVSSSQCSFAPSVQYGKKP